MTDARLRCLFRVTAVLLLGLFGSAWAGGEKESWLSRDGHFRLSYTSELQPLAINRMHSWIIRLETVNGLPVDDASITIAGGMPLHDHGLPSRPKVTENLGDGRYRIGGMRFHMLGDWNLTISIETGARRGTVIIPLKILQ